MDRGLPGRVIRLIAPVVSAGLVHVLILKLDLFPGLALPLDAGARWRGKPVLGGNKTWRGPVVMMAGTALVTRLRDNISSRPIGARRAAPAPWLAGALMGLAYILAELPNSFVKRRLGIEPGARSRRFGAVQYLIDQLDSVLGCAVAIRLLYRPPRAEITGAVVLGTAAHVAVDGVMHVVGLKRS